MSDRMAVGDAWRILGEDPGRVVSEIRSAPKASRADVAERLLERAKRTARRMMIQNHPDKNPGDPGAQRRFVAIQRALSSLEEHTSEFRKKLSERIAADEDRNSRRVRIEVGPDE